MKEVHTAHSSWEHNAGEAQSEKRERKKSLLAALMIASLDGCWTVGQSLDKMVERSSLGSSIEALDTPSHSSQQDATKPSEAGIKRYAQNANA